MNRKSNRPENSRAKSEILDSALRFLLREEDDEERVLKEIEKVIDPFWDRAEALNPAFSRDDDPLFMLVTGLVSDIEDASYKAGFLAGFALAQEIEIEEENAHRAHGN